MARLPAARFLALTAALCAVFLAGCASDPPLPPLPAPDAGPREQSVHVASNGWHATLVLPREAVVASGLLPEAEHFPDAAFLEFGWGDRVYFPAEEKTIGMTLDAALVPTPAVMHVAGLSAPPSVPEDGDADAGVIELALTETEQLRLLESVTADFERVQGGPAEPSSEGLSPGSRFYDARGEFHLFNTCNTWTARKLRAAGLDVSPSGVVTAGELMGRVREAAAAEGRLRAETAASP